MTKENLIIIVIGLAVLLGGGALIIFGNDQPVGQSSMSNLSFEGELNETIPNTEKGIHYHPELSIHIKGEKQEIPADIGIGSLYSSNRFYDSMMQMTDIHTHDNSGTLHWEVMQGPVKIGYLKLSNFFEIWDKPFNSNQIFDKTNGLEGTVKMFVNGQPNNEFENYLINDKDKIDIRFE